MSFTANELDLINVGWVSAPRPISAAPYNGREVGLVLGAAGEWIELIEAEVTDEALPVKN